MSAVISRWVTTTWKRVGVKAEVPDNHVATLMYYFRCVCSVLRLNHVDNENRLKDYKRYYDMTLAEVDNLVDLCNKYNPNAVCWFFEAEELCGDGTNEFYEVDINDAQLAALHERMGNLSRTVIVANHSSDVVKLMVYRKSWLQENFVKPISALRPWQEAFEQNRPRPIQKCKVKVAPRDPFPDSGKFADNISANILISYFFPFWIFGWIFMAIMQA